uniref:Phosphatidylinositol 3,4,5-trisphosphate 3-phosphatase and dual-specificity protein phosphatase PTEN n=1 Tax=Arcella intermedia TaxID=1963864 RepID=A0A6B2L1U6_9EUKA
MDLAYITARIIAMGYPSRGVEKYYRNQMEDVQAFFKEYHQTNYKVYNLCSERKYPPDKFANFSYYPFDDHNVPPLELIDEFCADASAWLDKDEKNVVAVHCKAGKGRTGLMISTLLAYKYPQTLNIDKAFKFYNERRTFDGKGVTIPSQVRFAKHFDSIQDLCKEKSWQHVRDNPKELVAIEIINPLKSYCVWFTITTSDKKTFDFPKDLIKRYKDAPKILFPVNFVVNRETKVSFYSEESKTKPLFYFWFHTKFVTNPFVLPKSALDKLKDKELYDPEFSVIVHFKESPAPQLVLENKLQQSGNVAVVKRTSKAVRNELKKKEVPTIYEGSSKSDGVQQSQSLSLPSIEAELKTSDPASKEPCFSVYDISDLQKHFGVNETHFEPHKVTLDGNQSDTSESDTETETSDESVGELESISRLLSSSNNLSIPEIVTKMRASRVHTNEKDPSKHTHSQPEHHPEPSIQPEQTITDPPIQPQPEPQPQPQTEPDPTPSDPSTPPEEAT